MRSRSKVCLTSPLVLFLLPSFLPLLFPLFNSSFIPLLIYLFIHLFIYFNFFYFCIHLGVHNIIFGQLATIAFTMMEIGLSDDEVFKNLKTNVQIVETVALPLIIFFLSYFVIFHIILNTDFFDYLHILSSQFIFSSYLMHL